MKGDSMTDCKFEVGKTYKTRDGRDAKLVHIYGEERDCSFKLLWVREDAHHTTTLDGFYYKGTANLDVLPPKQSGELWLNIYHAGGATWGRSFNNREEANFNAGLDRIACVAVQWEEGQFDD